MASFIIRFAILVFSHAFLLIFLSLSLSLSLSLPDFLYQFVPVDSSHPGYGRYLYFPTQNHLTICKPKTELDENYSALIQFLQDAIKSSQRKTQ